ncbi:hypothetical protein ACTMU2_13495 [Cupriavidus basilensis]
MDLPTPYEFVFRFMTRTGRITTSRAHACPVSCADGRARRLGRCPGGGCGRPVMIRATECVLGESPLRRQADGATGETVDPAGVVYTGAVHGRICSAQWVSTRRTWPVAMARLGERHGVSTPCKAMRFEFHWHAVAGRRDRYRLHRGGDPHAFL